MWFAHDGAPSHFRRDMLDYLNEIFQGKWLGRDGPTWPPHFPDLSPLCTYGDI